MKSTAAMGFLAVAMLASPASAADPSIERIGRCIAYYAVIGGMDGENAVDAQTAGIVRELGVGLYAAADRAKMPEEDMQNKVVAELLAINLKLRENGKEAVRKEFVGECESVVDAVRGIP